MGTISEKSYQEHTLPLIHKLILKIKGITSSFISCKMGVLDIEHVGHLQSYKNVEFVLFFSLLIPLILSQLRTARIR